MTPQELPLPGTWPTATKEVTVDTDKSTSASAHSSTEQKLAKLEERLTHELMDEAERQELRDRVLRLRRRMTREEMV